MFFKNAFIIIILFSFIIADDVKEIFLGELDRGSLNGKRVTVSGFVKATGCEKIPCKLRIKRRVKNAYVILNLTFKDIHQKEVSRKKVLDPIFASCVYIDPFHYEECTF